MAKKTRNDVDEPGARPPLSRERILAAAVEIADVRGVGASVTPRGISHPASAKHP